MKILTKKQYNTLMVKADKNSKYKESDEVKYLQEENTKLRIRINELKEILQEQYKIKEDNKRGCYKIKED